MPALSRTLAIEPMEVFCTDNTSYPFGIIIPVLYAQKSTINVLKVPRVLTLSNQPRLPLISTCGIDRESKSNSLFALFAPTTSLSY
jgi:hypothetical protein